MVWLFEQIGKDELTDDEVTELVGYTVHPDNKQLAEKVTKLVKGEY